MKIKNPSPLTVVAFRLSDEDREGLREIVKQRELTTETDAIRGLIRREVALMKSAKVEILEFSEDPRFADLIGIFERFKVVMDNAFLPSKKKDSTSENRS